MSFFLGDPIPQSNLDDPSCDRVGARTGFTTRRPSRTGYPPDGNQSRSVAKVNRQSLSTINQVFMCKS